VRWMLAGAIGAGLLACSGAAVPEGPRRASAPLSAADWDKTWLVGATPAGTPADAAWIAAAQAAIEAQDKARVLSVEHTERADLDQDGDLDGLFCYMLEGEEGEASDTLCTVVETAAGELEARAGVGDLIVQKMGTFRVRDGVYAVMQLAYMDSEGHYLRTVRFDGTTFVAERLD
jgi:hypothetical protein